MSRRSEGEPAISEEGPAEKREKQESSIEEARNLSELFDAIQQRGEIQGSRKKPYSPGELNKKIESVRNALLDLQDRGQDIVELIEKGAPMAMSGFGGIINAEGIRLQVMELMKKELTIRKIMKRYVEYPLEEQQVCIQELREQGVSSELLAEVTQELGVLRSAKEARVEKLKKTERYIAKGLSQLSWGIMEGRGESLRPSLELEQESGKEITFEKVSDFDQLYEAISKKGEIVGSLETHKAVDIIQKIEQLRITAKDLQERTGEDSKSLIDRIHREASALSVREFTRQGGLRNKVIELLEKEIIERETGE